MARYCFISEKKDFVHPLQIKKITVQLDLTPPKLLFLRKTTHTDLSSSDFEFLMVLTFIQFLWCPFLHGTSGAYLDCIPSFLLLEAAHILETQSSTAMEENTKKEVPWDSCGQT